MARSLSDNVRSSSSTSDLSFLNSLFTRSAKRARIYALSASVPVLPVRFKSDHNSAKKKALSFLWPSSNIMPASSGPRFLTI